MLPGIKIIKQRQGYIDQKGGNPTQSQFNNISTPRGLLVFLLKFNQIDMAKQLWLDHLVHLLSLQGLHRLHAVKFSNY